MVACVTATDSFTPPMVILDRETLPPCVTVRDAPGTANGMSAKG